VASSQFSIKDCPQSAPLSLFFKSFVSYLPLLLTPKIHNFAPMKSLPFLYFLFITAIIHAAPGDTTHVQFHNKIDMNAYGNYDFKGAFPSTGKSWNKIMMKYTMGCSSTGCSGWDYTTHIQYLQLTGVLDSNIASIDTLLQDTTWNVYPVIEKYELARVITPYGTYMNAGSNGYTNNWRLPHWYDVTDFASILHDSAILRAFYSGWSSGFSVTLDFYFIEGTPSRPVLALQNLWGKGGDSYGYNSASFEKNVMFEKKAYILPATKLAKVTFVPSGHGFDNSLNAAEFYDEPFDVKVNNVKIATNHIWNNQCGQNPVFPQGGTWIYNRANWCPGSKVGEFSYEVGKHLKVDTNAFDIDFEPYSTSGNQGPSYTISSMLFQYGDYQYSNEASIEDIISPSKDSSYIRLNPICSNPVIVIKNYGKDDLSTLQISYGLIGNTKQVYHWSGKLKFGESQKVSLPMLNWVGASKTSVFEVTIDKPNGKADELMYNNTKISGLLLTQKLDNKLIVWLRTNNSPTENSYNFKDGDGKVLFSRSGFAAATLYKDTFTLPDGCISFELHDDGGNGIDWWANKQTAGSGYCWIRNLSGTFTKKINPDFGNAIVYRFNTTYGLPVEEQNANDLSFYLYPNPAKNYFVIDAENANKTIQVQVFDLTGKLITAAPCTGTKTINTEGWAEGLYFVRIENEGSVTTYKVVVE